MTQYRLYLCDAYRGYKCVHQITFVTKLKLLLFLLLFFFLNHKFATEILKAIQNVFPVLSNLIDSMTNYFKFIILNKF